MGWIEDLQGKVIGLGTASLFLYIISQEPPHKCRGLRNG